MAFAASVRAATSGSWIVRRDILVVTPSTTKPTTFNRSSPRRLVAVGGSPSDGSSTTSPHKRPDRFRDRSVQEVDASLDIDEVLCPPAAVRRSKSRFNRSQTKSRSEDRPESALPLTN